MILSANQAIAAPKKKEGPTRIRSDIIDIKRKSQTVNFLKNVVVEKEDSSLLAQKMTLIYYDKEAIPEGASSIERIDAWDSVKIFTEEFIASGDVGHYDPTKDIFVLEQNVIVNNGSSIASGDKFVYDLTTKKGYFVGKNEQSLSAAKNAGSQDNRVVVVIGNDLREQKKSAKKSKTEDNEKDTKRP